jgi:hypothetical protein
MTASREPSGQDEIVTRTGIRITGAGAQAVARQLAQPPRLRPGRMEDALYGALFAVRPRTGRQSPVTPLLDLLSAAIVDRVPGAPRLTCEGPAALPPSRFTGLAWDCMGGQDSWFGELLWRHPHPVVSGAPLTTHVMIIEQPGHTQLHLRVTADEGTATVRGAAGAGQARPAFLTEMHQSLRLNWNKWDGSPIELTEAEIDSFVRDTLIGDDRVAPVAVLAPREDGGFVVPPTELADALMGLATLHVITRHQTTYRLSDALGDRRLSAYWGALRIYMPGFSCADRPSEHPLLVGDQLIDPVMRADVLGRLGREAGQRFVMPTSIEDRRAAAAARPAPPAPVTPAPSAPPSAPVLPATTGLLAAIDQLSELTRVVRDELIRLRMALAVRSANTNALERRIERFEERMLQMLAPDAGVEDAEAAPAAAVEEQTDEERPSLVETLRQAAAAHPETLLILETAERAAAASPYEDLERVSAVLDAMADVARRRAEGSLGMSLRDAFREVGVDYRGGIADSTPARLRHQYVLPGPDGRGYDCVEHLVLGTSYDPRHCLRIYFTSRSPNETRFVIGHVGRHFEVMTTT